MSGIILGCEKKHYLNRSSIDKKTYLCDKEKSVPPPRLELGTPSLVGRCSIRLSYGGNRKQHSSCGNEGKCQCLQGVSLPFTFLFVSSRRPPTASRCGALFLEAAYLSPIPLHKPRYDQRIAGEDSACVFLDDCFYLSAFFILRWISSYHLF